MSDEIVRTIRSIRIVLLRPFFCLEFIGRNMRPLPASHCFALELRLSFKFSTSFGPVVRQIAPNMRLSGRAVKKVPVVLRCRAAQLWR